MKKLLEFIWDGCWHKWELVGQGNILINGKEAGIYTRHKCSKCQLVKDRRV